MSTTTRDGFTVNLLSNEVMSVGMVPELGAKIVELTDLRVGHSWLAPLGELEPLKDLGDRWDEYDKSGWDELIPSIGPGRYPWSPWQGSILRDHGDLWQRPCRIDVRGEVLTTTCSGLGLPFEFSRSLELNGPEMYLHYEVTNTSSSMLAYIWAMHPLLAVREGTRILLSHPTQVYAEAALSSAADIGAKFDWPMFPDVSGALRDVSTFTLNSSRSLAVKLFAEGGSVSRAALVDPEGHWLGFSWDATDIPFLGLWINEGIWPEPENGLCHLAIEPTTTPSDYISDANREILAELEGGQSRRWSVSLRMGAHWESPVDWVEGTRQ